MRIMRTTRLWRRDGERRKRSKKIVSYCSSLQLAALTTEMPHHVANTADTFSFGRQRLRRKILHDCEVCQRRYILITAKSQALPPAGGAVARMNEGRREVVNQKAGRRKKQVRPHSFYVHALHSRSGNMSLVPHHEDLSMPTKIAGVFASPGENIAQKIFNLLQGQQNKNIFNIYF